MTNPTIHNEDISRKAAPISRAQLRKQYTEWATSGTRQNGTLVVEIWNSNGKVDIVGLGDLAKRGLPTPARTRRRGLSTDFSSWHSTSAAKYAEAFGISNVGDGHQVFELEADGRRFIIPSLVLMRALFRPHRYVLTEMFRPHGLERVCSPTNSSGSLSVVPNRKWPSLTRQYIQPSILEPLAWMYSFPSARRMCGSVHEQISNRTIGMSLPVGKVRMVVHALENGSISYVTAMTIIGLETSEMPYPFARNSAKYISFHKGVLAADGRIHRQCTSDPSIPCHPGGGTDVSESEWNAVAALFKMSSNKHHPRLLLNGIIAKLTSGTSWHKTSYVTGSWSNASALFQRLKADGRWQIIQRILQESRLDLSTVQNS